MNTIQTTDRFEREPMLIPPPRFTVQHHPKKKKAPYLVEMELWGNFDFIGTRDPDATETINLKLHEDAVALGAYRPLRYMGPPIFYRFSMPNAEAARQMVALLIAAVKAYVALPVVRLYLGDEIRIIDPDAVWKVGGLPGFGALK